MTSAEAAAILGPQLAAEIKTQPAPPLPAEKVRHLADLFARVPADTAPLPATA